MIRSLAYARLTKAQIDLVHARERLVRLEQSLDEIGARRDRSLAHGVTSLAVALNEFRVAFWLSLAGSADDVN